MMHDEDWPFGRAPHSIEAIFKIALRVRKGHGADDLLSGRPFLFPKAATPLWFLWFSFPSHSGEGKCAPGPGKVGVGQNTLIPSGLPSSTVPSPVTGKKF